jgi:hypothetical protein
LVSSPRASTAEPSCGQSPVRRHKGGFLSIPKNAIGIQLYRVRDKVWQLGFRVVFEELSRMGCK